MRPDQTHYSFKAFTGSTLQQLNVAVSAFSSRPDIAVKSMSIEYLDPEDLFVLTLGYRQASENYSARLMTAKVGFIDVASSGSATKLESKLEALASAIPAVIGHGLFIRPDGEMRVIFLVRVQE
jgi:hypothetical protein